MNWKKLSRMDKKRMRRLIQKAQKAKVLDSVESLLSIQGWNQRFRQIARLRANQ